MIRTAKFSGVKYRVKFTDKMPDGEHGSIDEPEYENPVMLIKRSLTGKVLFETEVHEALHGIFPYLKEEMIESGAADLVTYLTRRGYRLCNCVVGKPVNQEIEEAKYDFGTERCEDRGQEIGAKADNGDGGLALRQRVRPNASLMAQHTPEVCKRKQETQG